MFFSLVNFNPTGLVIQEQVQEYTEPLNLEFSEPSTYEWQIQNPGQLTSVKLSGEVLGEGTVKIYFENSLVFDSSKPQGNTGLLTGLAIEETPESAPAESTTSESSESAQSSESSEEPAVSTPSETDSSESSEEPAVSNEPVSNPTQTETQEQEDQSSSQPQITQEDLPVPEETTEEPSEPVGSDETPIETTEPTNVTQPINITPETPVNVTPPIPTSSIPEPKTTKFKDVCEETCQLSLNKTNYTIRIEINNATVLIDEIKYNILTETIMPASNITNETVTNLTDANITRVETNTSQQIVIGQPVKWKKTIELDKPGKIKVKLPKQAKNITVKKIKDSYSEKQEVHQSSESSEELGSFQPQLTQEQSLASEANFAVTSVITGRAAGGFFSRIASITGRAVTTEETVEDIEVTIEDSALEYEIEYETPGPQAKERTISNKEKQISVSAPDELGYTNVLAYSYLEKEVSIGQVALYHHETGRVKIKAYDLDQNGLVDYVEWNVPHLSEQNYSLVIEITSAEHLDKNKKFISDIYPAVSKKDNIWTSPIPNGDYVRVSFEENLTKDNDIKIYVRGSGSIEVYSQDSEELITTFNNIDREAWYRIYLDNLGETSHDTFDLKILGEIEFDYIVDPNLNLEIFGDINEYYASVLLKTNVNANASYDAWDIVSSPPPSNYSEFYSNISDGTSEYHLTVDTWNASENPRDLYLIYYIDSAQTGSLNFSWESLDGTEYYMNFSYYGNDETYSSLVATRDMQDHTGYNASISSASLLYVMIDYNKDETPPKIIIKSPTNTTYPSTTIDFNISSDENLSSCVFTLDNWNNNYTLTRFNDTYFNFTNSTMSEGSFLTQFWCNDSAGNINNTESQAFSVQTDISSVSNCKELTQANTQYNLTANIINNTLISACINITAENITLDCKGFYIQSNESYAGVYSNKYNTTIKNCNINMGNESGGEGIYLYEANNSYIFNNSLNNQYSGIHVRAASNVTIMNNTATFNAYTGIFLFNVSNSLIISNNASNNIWNGMDIYYSENDEIINNTFNQNSAYGIFFSITNFTELANNRVFSNGWYGIYIIDSYYNNFINNNFWNCSGDTYSCLRLNEASNNTFIGNKINKSSNYGLWIYSGGPGDSSSNNVFKDMSITNTSSFSVFIEDMAGSENQNNTFINASWDGEEAVNSSSELIRKWWYRAYVNDSNNNNIQNANVTAFNSSGNFMFNLTTDVNGYTPLASITDYINSSGTTYYYSNYTIYADNETSSDSHTYNSTSNQNNYKDVFTITSAQKTIIQCAILNQPNTQYNLTANIINNTLISACINITAENITLECNGFYISSDDGYNGVFSNQFNTTIKNCNISMGPGSQGDGIVLYSSNNSYIYNNILNYQSTGLELDLVNNLVVEELTASLNSYRGIYSFKSNNNRFSNITANENAHEGIFLDAGKNNMLYNATANLNNDGIYLNSELNDTLSENNMSGNTNYNFILFFGGSNNKIHPNNIVDYSYRIYHNYSISDYSFNPTTAPDAGIAICINCQNVTYKNLNLSHHNYHGLLLANTSGSKVDNVSAGSANQGISLLSSHNNTLSNLYLTSNIHGIFSSYLSNNTFTNMTVIRNYYGIYSTDGSNNAFNNINLSYNYLNGIELSNSKNFTFNNLTAYSNYNYTIIIGTGSENKFFNSTIFNCAPGESRGCIFIAESDYNLFENIKINKSDDYGIRMNSLGAGDTASHNLFKNIEIYETQGNPFLLEDGSGSQNLNNTCINCSYENESVDTSSELIRKWWYRAYVNDSNNNNIQDANVTAFNSSDDFMFNLTTEVTGYTPLTSIIDYVNISGTTYHYSNYTIYADNETLSDSHTYNSTANQNNYKDVFTITSGTSAPEIYAVYNQTLAIDIQENTFTSVIINFSVYDANGFANLNDSSSIVNLSFSGEDLRENVSCYPYEQSGNYANYTCNVTMWWWDTNDTWTINAYIEDTDSYSAINTSSTQEVGSTQSFIISPTPLLWQSLSPGMTNATSTNDPMIINNTGNIPYVNVTINATNLRGEEDNSKALWAGNFSVGISTGGSPPLECGGSKMHLGLFTQVTSANLTKGNYTINDGTAQEQIYFCLTVVGSDLTKAQAYSTTQEGSWTIRLVEALVAFALAKRRKKKKKYKVPTSIFTKELGGLEALVKYLKEKLQLTYKEIAEEIDRNERTVWTAYNKAVEKVPEPLDETSETTIELSVFKTKLTPLAAAISYFKDKGLRNKEIARILHRDERNVWTIYNRIKDKLPEKPEKLEPIEIPISIFTKELGGLEAVVKYMRENLRMKYSEIAKLLNRDDRTIWTSYDKAKVKKPQKLRAKGILIPLSIFTENTTVLEAIINYLKQMQMKYSEIGKLLHRDERNIWTIYNKNVKKE